jgi:hypothetical protein
MGKSRKRFELSIGDENVCFPSLSSELSEKSKKMNVGLYWVLASGGLLEKNANKGGVA